MNVMLGIRVRGVARAQNVTQITTNQASGILPVMHVTQVPPVLPDLQQPRTVHVQRVGTREQMERNVCVTWDTQDLTANSVT